METYYENNVSINYNDSYLHQPEYTDYSSPGNTIPTIIKVFNALKIVSAVINTGLLLTAISKAARSCSVSWYMYHLTFVTVFQTIIELVFAYTYSEGLTHVSCVFLQIASLALMTLNIYSIVLMDIDLILTLAPNTNGGEPIRRFLITVLATWSVSVIFSVIVHFVGDTSKYERGFCFALSANRTISFAIAQWIPSGIICICVCIGCWFFSRSRRQPQNYGNGAVDLNNRSFNTGLFVFCIIWSGFECFRVLVQFVLVVGQINSIYLIYAYMVCSLVHFYLPVLCVLLGSVRMAIKSAIMFVIKN